MASAMPSALNYHRWVFDSFSGYLNKDLVTLEVGAGHGVYTKLLLNISRKVIATDIDQQAVIKINKELSPNMPVKAIFMNGIDTAILNEPVDNIVAINVIEHMERDNTFIRNCYSVLNPSGRLVIFAPAFPLLFSKLDKEAGHFRRYYRADIEDLLINNGFKLLYSRYFNFIGFWGWLINKYIGSGINSSTTNLQVTIFDKFIKFCKWFDIFSVLLGQSILLVGEKS